MVQQMYGCTAVGSPIVAVRGPQAGDGQSYLRPACLRCVAGLLGISRRGNRVVWADALGTSVEEQSGPGRLPSTIGSIKQHCKSVGESWSVRLRRAGGRSADKNICLKSPSLRGITFSCIVCQRSNESRAIVCGRPWQHFQAEEFE